MTNEDIKQDLELIETALKDLEKMSGLENVSGADLQSLIRMIRNRYEDVLGYVVSNMNISELLEVINTEGKEAGLKWIEERESLVS